MVDLSESSQIPHVQIVEQFVAAKTANPDDCEDAIFTNAYFAVVIDGSTSKSERRWASRTNGKVASEIVSRAFSQMPPNATVYQAADLVTAGIYEHYWRSGVIDIVRKDPAQRIAASYAAMSFFRQECWLVGDCQCLLDNERISNVMKIDRVLSEARSLFLESEILRGVSIDELREHDTGREFILPLLNRQTLFQNNPSTGENCYTIVDGFPTSGGGIIVRNIPEEVSSIVLATDGYPVLGKTLEESERLLQELLLRDPLLFREYKATKGMLKGQISFDDRAYIRLKLVRKPNM